MIGQTGPCTRAYTLDANSNRTALTQTGPAGACPSSVKAADTYSYDTADRLQPTTGRSTLRYDRFGRTRVLPSTDTVDAGGDLSIDYYLNDLVASQTQAGRTTSYTLDPALRRTQRTDTTTANPTPAVAVNHYDDDSDNPDWTSESDGSWTRNTSGFGDLAATVSSTGTVTLQLADLHGDILATVPVTASSPTELQVQESTEYGLPRNKPTAGALLPRYGYLGAQQRDASTPGGPTLMGVRLYIPTLGRFLTTDPVAGGSANDYDYVGADPVNSTDLNGQWRRPRWVSWRNAGRVSAVGAFGVCTIASFGACAAVGVGAGLIAARASAGRRCLKCWSFGRSAFINSLFAVGGAYGGKYLGRAYERFGPRVAQYSSRVKRFFVYRAHPTYYLHSFKLNFLGVAATNVYSRHHSGQQE